MGAQVDLDIPRSFWSRLAGKYGNIFYWKEKVKFPSIRLIPLWVIFSFPPVSSYEYYHSVQSLLQGEDASIEAAVNAISYCLREPVGPSNCSEVR